MSIEALTSAQQRLSRKSVPPSWSLVRLGDIFSQVVDRGHDKDLPVLAVTMDGGVLRRDSLERRSDREVDRAQYLRVQPGDIAYNTMRMWQGASGVVHEEGYISPAYTVCRPTSTECVEFWAYCFKSPTMIRAFRDHSQGFAKDRYRLYFHHFASVPALRPPLPEQRKIAAILSSVDKVISESGTVAKQLQTVKMQMMRELLSQGLPGRQTKPKATRIGEIPEDWETETVGNIAQPGPYSCVGGPFGSDLTSKDYTPSGIPVLRGTNLSGAGRWIRESDFVFVSESKAMQLERNLANPGDIVFTQRGTLGQVARIRPDSPHRKMLLSQSQMKLTVDPERIDPDFIVVFFQSPAGQAAMQKATIATGVPHINLGILKSFLVPVPSLEAQRTIAAAIGCIESQLEAEATVLNSLRKVKSALSAALLSGQIRVTPDPEPEPAASAT